MGSFARAYLRVEIPASIRSVATWVNRSVWAAAAKLGNVGSVLPSVAATRGRRTATRRPPNTTEDAVVPFRTNARSGSFASFGPHSAARSSSNISDSTANPAVTDNANNPSRAASAIPASANLTSRGKPSTAPSSSSSTSRTAGPSTFFIRWSLSIR